eukprot:10227376-Alexandrium_andersonii.AAC.1
MKASQTRLPRAAVLVIRVLVSGEAASRSCRGQLRSAHGHGGDSGRAVHWARPNGYLTTTRLPRAAGQAQARADW